MFLVLSLEELKGREYTVKNLNDTIRENFHSCRWDFNNNYVIVVTWEGKEYLVDFKVINRNGNGNGNGNGNVFSRIVRITDYMFHGNQKYYNNSLQRYKSIKV